MWTSSLQIRITFEAGLSWLRAYCISIKKSVHKSDSYCYSSAEQAVILDLSVRTE